MWCDRMSLALSLLLSLSCTLLQGTLWPPRDVKLEAQNFHVRLQWEPDPGSPSGATYQVEWRKRTSHWTKADTCWRNSTSPSWACELYFDKIHDIYWARVRTDAGGELSKWTGSSELQPYRDTIVGPPELSWLLHGYNLTVNITMPLTPYRSKTGSYKPVDRVLRKLWYRLNLYEGDKLIQQVPCKRSREEVSCTFSYLMPSTQYCIRTAVVGMAREQSQEAEQCLVTPVHPAGFPWVLLVILSGVFLLLTVAGLCFIWLYACLSPSEMHLPKMLVLLNKELSVTIRVPALELEEGSLALLLPALLPSDGLPDTEQTPPMGQLLLGESCSQDMSCYCANGFGPHCLEEKDSSLTHSHLGHCLGSWVAPQLEEDGDDELEQPVQVGLTQDSYACDGHYQTSEMWLSLHLQLYSKCQCSAQGPGNCFPLPIEGGSFSQEDLQESLGLAEHWVMLSSVKLLASGEEDGGQLICALQPLPGHETEPGDSTVKDSEVGILGACQLPQFAPKIQHAVAFSSYELCPQVDAEQGTLGSSSTWITAPDRTRDTSESCRDGTGVV